MKFEHFCGPSYTVQNPNADAEVCMNWYVEAMEMPGAKTQYVLNPCPGFSLFGTVSEGPNRGVFATGELTNRVFGVFGFKLYEFDASGLATDRGDVANDGLPASFATNSTAGGQMMVASGGTLYVYDLALNTLTDISALSGVPISQVVYLANRFVGLDATASAYYWSAINDGSSWSSGSKAVRSTAADPWVSVTQIQATLRFNGTLTSDIYTATDNADDPFAPIPGALIEYGNAAAFSAVNVSSSQVWLSQNVNGRGMVHQSNGYDANRISTHAVEVAIQGYETISDAVAFSYQQDGHGYYVLNFPAAEATWVYDTATGLWHQRGYWDINNSEFTRYRAQYACSAFGLNIVGDPETGTLYSLTPTSSEDVDGAMIRRVRRSPHFWDGGTLNQVRVPGLQIDLQTGLGDPETTGAPPLTNTPPLATLRVYKNNDFGFPAITSTGSAGNLGQYGKRLRYLNLGKARDFVFELQCSDAIPWRVTQALFTPEPIMGAH